MDYPAPTDHHRYRHDRGSDVRKTTGSAEDLPRWARQGADGTGKDARIMLADLQAAAQIIERVY